MQEEENLTDWRYELPFSKIAEVDEVMYIAGEASNPDRDEDDEEMDMDSLKGTFDKYMSNPVVKFMHDKAPQWVGAIGKVVEKFVDSKGVEHVTSFGNKPHLVIEIKKNTVPGWMWNSIRDGVYKGLSIGGKALKKVNGRIFVKSWLETSVVDVPSAQGAFFSVLKSACMGDGCPLEKGGAGSGPKKGLKREKTKIGTLNTTFAEMDIKVVKEKLLEHMNSGDIQSLEGKHGDKALRAKLQSAVTGETVSYKKMVELMELVEKRAQATVQVDSLTKAVNDFILDSFFKTMNKFDSGENMYKIDNFLSDVLKGGPGSGVRGHKTQTVSGETKELDRAKKAFENANKKEWAMIDEAGRQIAKGEERLKKAKKEHSQNPTKETKEEIENAKLQIGTGKRIRIGSAQTIEGNRKKYNQKTESIIASYRRSY